MIRHILLFRWTEGSASEDRAAAVKALRAMKDNIPSLKSLSVREALNTGAETFDGLLEAEFDDQAGYESYVVADSHQTAWTQYLQPVCGGLASIQVEA